nr:uncharacterized protein LOC128696100 [Cherax quadricarinatus]
MPGSMIISAKRFMNRDIQFPSSADLSRPTKMTRYTTRSMASRLENQKDPVQLHRKNDPKDITKIPDPFRITEESTNESEENKEKEKSSPENPSVIPEAEASSESRLVERSKTSENLIAGGQSEPQILPNSEVFTVDIPLSFEHGVPRLQTPKLITPRPDDASDKDSQNVQEIKSSRSKISTSDKGEENTEDSNANISGIVRSRSLVAITAEENFIYATGQSPRSSSSLSQQVESQPGQSNSSNHSKETQQNTAFDATNGKTDQMNEKLENQSESSSQSVADQSIPQDGVAGSTAGVKNSGGKPTLGGSVLANVAVSGGAEKDDASEPQKSISKVKEDSAKHYSAKSKDSGKALKNPQHDLNTESNSKDVTVPPVSTGSVVAQSTSLREDVLVEALVESARSNSGDKISIPISGNTTMPYQAAPRGTSLSSVEVPEGTISTVSLAVSKTESAVSRPLAVRDPTAATTGGIFDRFSTPRSLWQKAQPPLVVKSGGDPYSREPREYEDYLPREPSRPTLKRRGSLSKIDAQDLNDDDYDDSSLYNWKSKVKESRGAQTVRMKNQQPRHSILKKTDPRPTQRKDELRPSLKERIHEEYRDSPPIIIASGLVPKNLESLTSEYQAAHAGHNDDGGHGIGVSSHLSTGTTGHHGAVNSGHSGTGSNAYHGNSGHYTTGSSTYNSATYGPGGGTSYSNYPSSTNYPSNTSYPASTNYPVSTANRMGGVPASRSYTAKERDQFHERYLEPAPGGPATTPLATSQQKQNIGDVFDRLHSNRRPEHTAVVARKPEIKPKPKSVPPKAPARDGGGSSATTRAAVPESQRRLQQQQQQQLQQQQQAAANDVFSRLYQNAPSRKRRDEVSESSRLLEVPASTLQPSDTAPTAYKDTGKTSQRPAKDSAPAPAGRHSRSDTVLNMPLTQDTQDGDTPGLAPDIVVDDLGEPTPVHRGRLDYEAHKGGGNDKLPIVLLQGFFRGPGGRSPHHRRPSYSVSELTLPPHLVDVTSVLRGALPVLPRSLAALCLTLNIVLPGLGTAASGWLGICWGRNRMGAVETSGQRFTSVVVTAVTGFVQLFTVTFFLVGWFWGVAWGILLVSIANKYAHFLSEHRTSLTGAVSLEMLAVNAS